VATPVEGRPDGGGARWAKRSPGDRRRQSRLLRQTRSEILGFHAFLDRRLGTTAPQLALVRGPRVKASLPRPVTEDQARGLLAESEADPDAQPWEAARDRAVLSLLYGCGLRISEALSLLRSDAPLPDSLRITGKGGKTRMAPVLPAVRAAVEAYLALQPFVLEADQPLFRARRGGPLSPRHVAAQVQRLGGRAGPACPRPRNTPASMRRGFWAPMRRRIPAHRVRKTPRGRRPYGRIV